jgi:glyoxylase-like metal-dependent hydrolase (beta-lactamase superfamily II)
MTTATDPDRLTDAVDADLEALSEHLLLFRDTCNAYAVVDEDADAALVVDPGSGAILDPLEARGLDVEWVLHTHHHRDQCWGDRRLVEAGADVAVPEHEAHLFEDAERFWASKRLYDNYNDRSTFDTLPENVPVAETLDDYDSFSWRGREFEVLPAKGHTMGSSALLAEIDGRRVAFTGDLLRAGGRLHQLHQVEYGYGDMIGVPFTVESLRALRDAGPDVALPSHGEPITDPEVDAETLTRRLMDLVDLGPRMSAGSRAYLPEPRMVEVSEHLLWGGPWTCSNFYVVRSESGKALFVDYGHSMGEHMLVGGNREDMETMRFVEHHLEELRERHGIEEFDLVVPTHVHDDHTCGIPHLQEHYDVDCWALEEVAQVIEDPAAWSSTPCTYPEPIDVDRRLADGESFEWEEFAFDVYHAPGQTEFHSALAADIDGQTVAFTGDNYFHGEEHVHYDRREERPYQTTVFRNSFQFEMHRKCKDVMRAIQPEKVCPGHGEVLDCDPSQVATYCDFVDRKERVFRELTAAPAEQTVDLFWARLLPFQATARPGETVEYTLRLRNDFGAETDYRARLLGPDGRTPVDEAATTLAADGETDLDLALPVPADAGPGREVLTVAVAVDGESRGPVTEAVLHVEADGGGNE